MSSILNGNSDDDKSKYEGFFSPKPDERKDGIFGSTEVHRSWCGPDTHVHKDNFGNVTKVEERWLNW